MSVAVDVKARARVVRGRQGAPRAGVQVSEMQRSRLLSAAVLTVEELGWSGATVAHITTRARVSRRTFYDLFDNREDCLLAVLDDVVGEIERELSAAGLEGLSWRERVRGGLWTVLCFFDREPTLARMCVAQALQGGPRVLARREEILVRLAGVLDQGRRGGDGGARGGPPSLTAEGLVGATFSIVYARLARAEREPLTSLLGELMGMIVLPYQGLAVSRREQDRALPGAPVSTHGVSARDSGGVVECDPLVDIPMRLTYRTARVLETIAGRQGVSNRTVAELADVSDQGQISKLLARLERLELIENAGVGHAKGERNAWSLTARGVRVTQTISAHAHNDDDGEATS